MNTNLQTWNLPTDITKYISSLLQLDNKINFLSTSQDFKTVLNPCINIEKQALFTERFGALAQHELNKPIDEIATLHDRTLRLSINTKPLLAFDEQGYPYLTEDSNEELSWWETTCKRYRIFRGDPSNSKTCEKLREIFAEHKKIIQEFEEKTPLLIDATEDCEGFADLADRATRIHTIDIERKIYKRIIREQRERLDFSPFESLVFSVVSFFHSIFVTSIEHSCSNTLKNFRLRRTVNLGTRMIKTDNKEHEIALKGIFSSWNYFYIGIFSEGSDKSIFDKFIGYSRIVLHKADRLKYHHDFNIPYVIYTEPSLYHEAADYSGNLQDKPILKLLTQVAVEIFERQSCSKLVINSVYDHSAHYAVSGFSGRDDKEIALEVRKARSLGLLYPEYEDYSGFEVSLMKSGKIISTEGYETLSKKTKFSKDEYWEEINNINGKDVKIKHREVPSIIEDAEVTECNGIVTIPRTQEEYLEKHGRILSKGQRSVLPRIFSNVKNYSKPPVVLTPPQ